MSNIISFVPATSTVVATPVIEKPVMSAFEGTNILPVESHPITGPYGIIPNKKALYVAKKNINIVSDSYEVHQLTDIARKFQEISEKCGLQVTHSMFNKHNGGLMISANYSELPLFGKDPHKIDLVFYTSHDGRYKTFLSLNALRQACFNQVPIVYADKGRFIFAEKHYKNALDIDMIGEALAGIPESIAAFQEKQTLLADKTFSYADFIEFYIQHYKLDKAAKQFDSKVAKAKEVYHSATGQRGLPETAYKALNAITFINTHMGRETAYKAENTLLKGGNDSLTVQGKLLQVA